MLAGLQFGWRKNVHHSQMNGSSYHLDVDSILATSRQQYQISQCHFGIVTGMTSLQQRRLVDHIKL
ncbi:hypothetical protein T4C_6027 [Trichinella pseudospiralis]|uniref:Uncharacterized protein n=1 Tax=Trichinella pseudospiralis TaxID=6337 RepID=A0A0V1K7T3_TRIPS|nr:hypothetical protein T4C_6027 [Trichinella pseudospiralis]